MICLKIITNPSTTPQYKLNLTGITGGLTSGAVRGDDNVAGGMCDSKGTTSSSEGSM